MLSYNNSCNIITLDSSRNCGFTLSRHQFPVKPTFAMTVFKSQGQHIRLHWRWSASIIVWSSGVRRFDCAKLIPEPLQSLNKWIFTISRDHKEVYLNHLQKQLKKLRNRQKMVIFSNLLFYYSVYYIVNIRSQLSCETIL